jgi:hypothetical protein
MIQIQCIFLIIYVEAEVLVFLLASSQVIVLLDFLSRLVTGLSERRMVDIKWLDTVYHARGVFNGLFPDIKTYFGGEFLEGVESRGWVHEFGGDEREVWVTKSKFHHDCGEINGSRS